MPDTPAAPTITPDEVAELFADFDPEPGTTSGPWTLVATQHIRQSRWHDRYWLVLRYDPTGELWGLGYGVGLTENQDSDLPWDDARGPIRMDKRLYARQVTRTEYTSTPEV